MNDRAKEKKEKSGEKSKGDNRKKHLCQRKEKAKKVKNYEGIK